MGQDGKSVAKVCGTGHTLTWQARACRLVKVWQRACRLVNSGKGPAGWLTGAARGTKSQTLLAWRSLARTASDSRYESRVRRA
eukprot:364903-Chlamydomonas_euryale.AAC.5